MPPLRCLLSLLVPLLGVAPSLPAQIRLPATPPVLSYSTARAFPSLSFAQPVALVSPPGDTRRLFVVEKPGRIYVIPDVTAATPTRLLFLDLTSRVTVSDNSNDERGLLALAFHPDYAANGQFFLWYTTTATTGAGSGLHNRLSRFRVSADPNVAHPHSEEPLLTQRDEANNHNGGELLFGPDGYLYLSLGDEGGANDQYQNAHRIDRDFFAGILRLDVDRRAGSLAPNPHPAVHANTYAVPPDNPYIGATSHNGATINPASVRTEFWATGLRNPWRMSLDPATGRLWSGDVGQGQREEINVLTRGGNYGWPWREGDIAGPRGNPPANPGWVEPVWTYGRNDGLSVTGGLVYRGSQYGGSLTGRYLFADFGSGRLWALNPDEDRPVAADRVQLLTTDSGISSFGLDPATGDILLADLLENSIRRLVATTPSNTGFPATLSETGAFANPASLTPAAGVIPYEPNVSFWSDHARKQRWFALPAGSRFTLESDGRLSLPAGAVWVKHFDLDLTRGNPATARRVETRILVRTTDSVYGLTYRWNDAQTDAALVPDQGAEQTFTVTENGATRTQTWRFPSRAECLTCHTAAGGHALSFNLRQLNRGDQLAQLIAAGHIAAPASFAPSAAPALARADDTSASLEHRARSYLDANCSQCHQPGGPALGSWDARATTPLATANLLANSAIVPGQPAQSQILARMSTRGPGQMPPIATHERDLAGEALLREWIQSLAQTDPGPGASSRLVNLAARSRVDSSTQLITGFVIAGGSKRVLLRAAGPTLGSVFNLPGALPDPVLTVLGPDSSTRVAASNDNWQPADAAAFTSVGAFPFASASRDAALVAELAPGSYTAQVNAASGSGISLVEVYDLDSSHPVARLANLSIRAHVGTGDDILIPGLAVSGGNKTLLLRAVGPGLGQFGVPGALAAPSLALLSGQQRLLTNTRWGTATNSAEIRTAATRVGAFALADADSAILTTLPPGSYTLQLSGANNTTGTALVEIYEVP